MSRLIKPANLRDGSWITAHLRPEDHLEAHCQLPDGLSNVILAEWLIKYGDAYIAYLDDEPVAMFGTAPLTVCAMSVWAIGTTRMPRVLDPVSRYLIDVCIPQRLDEGFTSMEARSLATHAGAHRWMESMGGVRHGPPFLYGKGGELFVLYRWTVASYHTIRDSRWSPK